MITRDGDNDIGCHAALHSLGRLSFEKAYYVNLDTLAEQTERAWQKFQRSDTGGER
jgi:hypothetical protein